MLTGPRASSLLALVSLFGALAVSSTVSGCSSPSELASSDVASEELQSSSGTVSDADLAAMIRKAPDPLTPAYRIELMNAALAPTVTTARLKMVNELAGWGLDKYRAGSNGMPDARQDEYSNLADQVQVTYCVAPRDVISSRGGQTFHTSLDGSALGGPVTVRVTGTASVDYTVDFTMSNHRLKAVSIPAGSTPEATAKRLSDAINSEAEAIEVDFFEEHGIGPDTGEYGGSDGLYSTVSGDTLTIDPAING
jgi:hypothetical protein